MSRAIVRLVPAVFGLFTLTCAAPAEAWDLGCGHSAERRAEIDTSGAKRLVVNARAGDLEVGPTSGTVARGHGRACASSEEYLRDTQIVARREGDVVYLNVKVPDELKGFGSTYANLDLHVEVPAALAVELVDSSGDIDAHDVRIEKITDSSGDMRLRGLQADVEIWDSSGDIRIDDAAGRVQIRDSSGDIVIHGARDVLIPIDSSGDIEIERVSGDVRIDQDSSGDIRIADVGHNVVVASDSSGEVKVRDVKGTVQLP